MEIQKKTYNGELRAATVRVDITDIGEQSYKGFFLKDCEIIDRIEAKITVLKTENQTFVWVCLDECSVRSCSAIKIINNLSVVLQIPSDHIMMACVHTHAAHNTGVIDIEMLSNILIKGVQLAATKIVTVAYIRQTIGQIDHIVNRRVELPKDLGGYCVMFNNQCKVDEKNLRIDATEQVEQFLQKSEGDGFIGLSDFKEYVLGKNFDGRIHQWEFLDKNEKPILVVVRVNAHPVIVSQSRVGAKLSADYVRVLENLIEKDLGCVCSVFNGAFGDTRPLTDNYSFEDREKFANRYFKALKASAPKTFPVMEFTWLTFKDVELQLREEMPRSIEGLKALREKVHVQLKEKIGSAKKNYDMLEVVESFLLDDNKRPSAIVYNNEIKSGYAVYQINGWAMGPMKILALPGEPLTDFAKAIENETGVLPIGLANGYLSYLPDIETLKKGGYEANQCVLSENGLKELIALSGYFKT